MTGPEQLHMKCALMHYFSFFLNLLNLFRIISHLIDTIEMSLALESSK